MLMKTMVIGCGRWGTFIAWYLNYVKQEVILYGRKDSKNMHQLLKCARTGKIMSGTEPV